MLVSKMTTCVQQHLTVYPTRVRLLLCPNNNNNNLQVAHLMRDVRAGRPSSMTTVNYHKSGRPFQVRNTTLHCDKTPHVSFPCHNLPSPFPFLLYLQNFLRVYPLTSSQAASEITHFLAVLEELPFLPGPPPPAIGSFDQQKQPADQSAEVPMEKADHFVCPSAVAT